jgi:superfamily II DNA or RNA helicase
MQNWSLDLDLKTVKELKINELNKEHNERPQEKIVFDHQREAIASLSRCFDFKDENYKGGLLVLPTGAGKTFTAVKWLCDNVLSRNIKILWLAHSSYLLEQAARTFCDNAFGISGRDMINLRVVSSSPKHSRASSIETTDDILIITTQTAILNFDTESHDKYGDKIITKFEKFLANNKNSRLVIVLDEAHHAPAYGFRNLFKGICDIVPQIYLLGLTATPTHNDPRISGHLFKIFNKKILYPPELGETGLTGDGLRKLTANLIMKKILARPNYMPKPTGKDIEVDDALYYRLVKDRKGLPDDIIYKLAHDSGRNDHIVKEYISHKDLYGKTIIFADRWFQCYYLKIKLIEKGVSAEVVVSKKEAGARTSELKNQKARTDNEKIMQEFREGKYQVLINVRMLTEGIDFPDVKTVFITSQTTSSILMTQMIGRALRGEKAGGGPNKDEANIVLFQDNWRRVINWALPDGDSGEPIPITKKYPIEYISIKLIEELSKIIESGVVVRLYPFLKYIPVGWYQTELLISVVDDGALMFSEDDFDYPALISKIRDSQNPLSVYMQKRLSPSTRNSLDGYLWIKTSESLAKSLACSPEQCHINKNGSDMSRSLKEAIVDDFNKIIRSSSLYEEHIFSEIALGEETQKLIENKPKGIDLIRLNSLLIEDAYPDEIERNSEDIREETKTLIEYVMVYDDAKAKFDNFIENNLKRIPEEWADEKLDECDIKPQIKEMAKTIFAPDDDIGDVLEDDLVRIARHIAQNKCVPRFYSFDKRDDHDLDKLVRKLKDKPDVEKLRELKKEFENEELYWKTFYLTLERFKTAFDASLNKNIFEEIYKSI